MSVRPIELLVWGATGVTGKRVCQQLAKEYTGKVKWAIAGRNREKLEALRNELAQIHDACKELALIVAQVTNKESIDAMVKQADVVLACAGPFALYSDAVVECCVKNSTHILDVTGETTWVRSVIDRFDEEAKSKGVKIVSFCGIDSVPSDMGVYFTVDHVRKRYGRGLTRVLGCFAETNRAKSPMSGGTIASMINVYSGDAKHFKLLFDPYSLNPANKRPSREIKDQNWPVYDKNFGFWTTSSVMQFINTRVVRRSCALSAVPYGAAFSYSECERMPNYFAALYRSVVIFVTGILVLIKPLRMLMFALGMLPRPGEGPSVEDEAKSNWKLTFYGLVEPESSSADTEPTIVTSCISDNFGGYTSTARMSVECALCQILDSDKLKEQSLPTGGALTPSTAFGNVLLQRLSAIGIKSEIL